MNDNIPASLRAQMRAARSKVKNVNREACSRGGKKAWANRIAKAKEQEAKAKESPPISGQATHIIRNPNIPTKGIW